MEAKDLILNNSSERQQIKQISVILPHIRISVLPQTLIVKSVDLSDLSRLVISSQNCYPVLEPYFQRDEQGDGLY